MIQGTQEVSLDAKGRMAVPTKFRAFFAAGGVLTAHPDGCLFLYPPLEWDRVRAQYVELPNADPQARWWQRVMIGHAEQVELDTAGRILIPQIHRSFAGIDSNVRLLGQINKFEIWDAERYNAGFESQRPMMMTGAPANGMERLKV